MKDIVITIILVLLAFCLVWLTVLFTEPQEEQCARCTSCHARIEYNYTVDENHWVDTDEETFTVTVDMDGNQQYVKEVFGPVKKKMTVESYELEADK